VLKSEFSKSQAVTILAFRNFKIRKRYAALLALLISVGVIWLVRAPLAAGIGRWWIIDRAPAKADAILVLGGGVENRPAKAAELYLAGWAPKILVLNTAPLADSAGHGQHSGDSATQYILRSHGVPNRAIVFIGDDVTSTRDEAEAVSDWLQDRKIERLLIPTDPFHTRRVTWFFGKQLRQKNVEIITVAVQPVNYDPATWWQSEGGRVALKNEFIKTVYYWLNY